jgi:hypothetical protein
LGGDPGHQNNPALKNITKMHIRFSRLAQVAAIVLNAYHNSLHPRAFGVFAALSRLVCLKNTVEVAKIHYDGFPRRLSRKNK